jgi:IS30 family transposase
MGRTISADKINQINEARIADPDAIGPMLGQLVIRGNVPIQAVADLLSVSEPTIYRWMYSESTPRDADKILKIQRLLTVLRKAGRAKDLPLRGSIKDRIKATGQLVIDHRPAKAT